MRVRMIGVSDTFDHDLPIVNQYKDDRRNRTIPFDEIYLIDLHRNVELLKQRFILAGSNLGIALNDNTKFFLYCFETPNGVFTVSNTQGIPLDGGTARYGGELLTKSSITDPIVVDPSIIIGEWIRRNVGFLFIDVFKQHTDPEWITALLKTLGFDTEEPEEPEPEPELETPKPRKKRRRPAGKTPTKSQQSVAPAPFTASLKTFVTLTKKRFKRTKEAMTAQTTIHTEIREQIANVAGQRMLQELDKSTERVKKLQYLYKTEMARLADLADPDGKTFCDRNVLRRSGVRVIISGSNKTITAQTGHIWATVNPKGQYLGDFTITIQIGSMRLDQINVSNKHRRIGSSQHYHVSDTGGVCWGKTTDRAQQYIDTGNYTALIILLVQLLKAGLSGDPFRFTPPNAPPEAIKKKAGGKK